MGNQRIFEDCASCGAKVAEPKPCPSLCPECIKAGIRFAPSGEVQCGPFGLQAAREEVSPMEETKTIMNHGINLKPLKNRPVVVAPKPTPEMVSLVGEALASVGRSPEGAQYEAQRVVQALHQPK
jgi:hypothetical protein